MKLATTIIQDKDSFCADEIDNRLNILDKLFEFTPKHAISLLCLPARYFYLKARKDIETISKKVIEKARKVDIAIAFGVDLQSNEITVNKKNINNNILPFIDMYAWEL